MPVIAELSGILLPVFCVAAVGYGWRRLGFPFEREFVTRVIMNVAGPCLIVDSLSDLDVPLAEFGDMVVGSVVAFGATVAAAWAALKAAGLSIRSYLPVLSIGNTGNMGLPLALFAFGEEGLAFAVAVYVTNSVGQFTLTPMLQSGERPLRTLATTPVVYGALVGALILVTGIRLPGWIATTIGLLGDLMIPLMLLALGNTLGGLKASRLPWATGWGAARIALGFAIAFGACELLGIDGTARGVLVLLGAMPAAIFNYLFAARYGRVPDEIAGIVLMSTLVSALTLPFLMAWVLAIAG